MLTYLPMISLYKQYSDTEMGNVTDNQLRIYHSMITKSLTKNTQIIWLSFSLTILTSDCLEQPSNYPFYISVSTLYGLHHIFDNFHPFASYVSAFLLFPLSSVYITLCNLLFCLPLLLFSCFMLRYIPILLPNVIY